MELIKVWRKDHFTLRLWDTYRRDSRGQTVLAYELKDGRKVIFSGSDFTGSPLHADDSRQTVAALLNFLSLKPGDTNREYFDKYTPEQMEWCQSDRCEYLGLLAYQMDIQHIPA